MTEGAPRSISENELGIDSVQQTLASTRLLDQREQLQRLIDEEQPILFTTEQVAEMFRVSPSNVLNMVHRGQLTVLNLRSIRIFRTSLVDALTSIEPRPTHSQATTEPLQSPENILNNLINGSERMLKISEIARMFQRPSAIIHGMINNGDLAAIRIGDTTRIPRSFLLDFLISQIYPDCINPPRD